MISLTDQLGREVSLDHWPVRIISTVPSQTELLYYLGLDTEIAGITKYCTHPANKTINKLKIGGTKQLDIPLIRSLKPDLIIANKEENERLQLEELMIEYPVYVSDPHDLISALQMIKHVGALVDHEAQANELITAINAKFEKFNPPNVFTNAAYLIWRKPYMAAGKNTFIDDMLRRCGFKNVFDVDRYPEVSLDMLKDADADIILLSSEPYPFKEKHVAELSSTIPDIRIKLVDGEMFSWYGSRLLLAADYFMTLTDNMNNTDKRN